MQGKLPNLLIIGSMKCGTTSLHNYLALHPEIFMSKPKEIHYYADENYFSKPISWYTDFFKTEKKIRGTSPQSYTKSHNKYYQNIPERIFKFNPNVKMIYIVRDPIERYLSHVLESFYSDPISDIIYSFKSDNFLKTSMYYTQISEYLKKFDIKQIHILSLESLQKNKLNELNKIFNFLNVKKLDDVSIFNFISNTAAQKKYPFFLKNNLFYRVCFKLFPKFTERLAFSFSEIIFKRFIKKPALSKEKIEKIKTILKPDIDKFRELTGNDFSNWQL